MRNADAWTPVSADEEGLVRVGPGKFVPISTLHQAMKEQFGPDAVTGIFGGQFHLRVRVAAGAIVRAAIAAGRPS
jgi:hypothetical protein